MKKTKGYAGGGKMKAKGMAGGGKMKAKGMSRGGKVKAKGMAHGGKMKTKGMAGGGKLPMVEKGGQMVPFYAADGKGKMAGGGKVRMSTKLMANGGPTMLNKKEGGNVSMRGNGSARSRDFGKNG